MTPEQAVKTAADRCSRRCFWATIASLTAGWILMASALLAGSWTLFGLGMLMSVPMLAFGAAAVAFQSDRMRSDLVERLKQKQARA